jgi:phage head maturation protease
MFLEYYGEQIRLRGYCTVWRAPSNPLDDGKTEYIDRGAFAEIIGDRRVTVPCVAHHANHLSLGDAAIWCDQTGLAFETAPLPATSEISTITGSIVRGGVRGASWRGSFDRPALEIVNGELPRVIRNVRSIEHVSPIALPAYPGTGVWASHESFDDMSPRLRVLMEYWRPYQPSRPVARPRTAPERRMPAAVTTARPRRAAAEPPFAEWAEPPAGVDVESWEWFFRTTSHAAREMRRGERLKEINRERAK